MSLEQDSLDVADLSPDLSSLFDDDDSLEPMSLSSNEISDDEILNQLNASGFFSSEAALARGDSEENDTTGVIAEVDSLHGGKESPQAAPELIVPPMSTNGVTRPQSVKYDLEHEESGIDVSVNINAQAISPGSQYFGTNEQDRLLDHHNSILEENHHHLPWAESTLASQSPRQTSPTQSFPSLSQNHPIHSNEEVDLHQSPHHLPQMRQTPANLEPSMTTHSSLDSVAGTLKYKGPFFLNGCVEPVAIVKYNDLLGVIHSCQKQMNQIAAQHSVIKSQLIQLQEKDSCILVVASVNKDLFEGSQRLSRKLVMLGCSQQELEADFNPQRSQFAQMLQTPESSQSHEGKLQAPEDPVKSTPKRHHQGFSNRGIYVHYNPVSVGLTQPSAQNNASNVHESVTPNAAGPFTPALSSQYSSHQACGAVDNVSLSTKQTNRGPAARRVEQMRRQTIARAASARAENATLSLSGEHGYGDSPQSFVSTQPQQFPGNVTLHQINALLPQHEQATMQSPTFHQQSLSSPQNRQDYERRIMPMINDMSQTLSNITQNPNSYIGSHHVVNDNTAPTYGMINRDQLQGKALSQGIPPNLYGVFEPVKQTRRRSRPKMTSINQCTTGAPVAPLNSTPAPIFIDITSSSPRTSPTSAMPSSMPVPKSRSREVSGAPLVSSPPPTNVLNIPNANTAPVDPRKPNERSRSPVKSASKTAANKKRVVSAGPVFCRPEDRDKHRDALQIALGAKYQKSWMTNTSQRLTLPKAVSQEDFSNETTATSLRPTPPEAIDQANSSHVLTPAEEAAWDEVLEEADDVFNAI